MPILTRLTLFGILFSTFAFADDAVVNEEFIYEQAPFPQCHASTIVETPNGLVAAWFGGTREKHPDVGIWVARHTADGWTRPLEVANGIQYGRPVGPPHRHPTWNPVLFQYPNGPLHLYFKCGPSPSTWWGMRTGSADHGRTWSTPIRLPDQIDGPVRNKPILLKNGTLLSGSSTEFDGWRLHFEFTADLGHTYSRTEAINDGKKVGAIQPTLLVHPNGHIQALNRNQNGQGGIISTMSKDNGVSWSPLRELNLPNPNSGIDAVTLKDGRFLLVYNHTHRRGVFPQSRSMLNVAVSDDGINWQAACTLEKEERSEFSYPAVIQSDDGMVHATYTWKRTRIKHVTIDPARLTLTPIANGEWPSE